MIDDVLFWFIFAILRCIVLELAMIYRKLTLPSSRRYSRFFHSSRQLPINIQMLSTLRVHPVSLLDAWYYYPKHKRSRIGPRYSSPLPRTFPCCITSTFPSWTKLRAVSRVGCIKLLQSIDEGISTCFESLRGISLGQHVFPACRIWSKVIISCLSFSSLTTLVKYFDLLVDFAFSGVATFELRDVVVPADSTKYSFRILLLPSSNSIPSSSSNRFFIWTFGSPSPHEWPNPPSDRSEATTLCQGTLSHGPYGLRPIADPTARAEVPSSWAIEP